MIKALRWVWTHWYIPVLVLVGFAGFVFGARRSNPSPLEEARGELAAIDEGEQARLMALKKGKTEANAAADLRYRETINALDARQKRKADTLRRDPARRARFLARVSRKRAGDAI